MTNSESPISTPLLVVGGGNMGLAIVQGACGAGVLDGSNVVVVEPDRGKHLAFGALGAACVDALDEGLLAMTRLETQKGNGAVLLAVKPQMLDEVTRSAGGRLGENRVVLSILAGVTTRRLTSALGGRPVRLMPNTPAQIGLGMTAICAGAGATPEDEALATRLFEAVGRVTRLPEDLLDAFTGVAGSGPAYVFLLAEGMLAGAEAIGFDREQGLALVRATLSGAAGLLEGSGADPAELRAMVTSKGGTTAAATSVLESRGVPEAIRDAIVAARDRGRELGGPA